VSRKSTLEKSLLLQEMELESDEEIQQVIDNTAKHVGIDSPRWSWNSRFSTVLGRAHFGPCRIELSKKIWPLCNKEMRYEVIVHEMCHVAAYIVFGQTGHCEEWIDLMNAMGFEEPSTHHKLDTTSVRPVAQGVCGCRVITVSKSRIARAKKMGADLICVKCNCKVAFS
jgi:predicted SprT family Zn-dependent metalloprotease